MRIHGGLKAHCKLRAHLIKLRIFSNVGKTLGKHLPATVEIRPISAEKILEFERRNRLIVELNTQHGYNRSNRSLLSNNKVSHTLLLLVKGN